MSDEHLSAINARILEAMRLIKGARPNSAYKLLEDMSRLLPEPRPGNIEAARGGKVTSLLDYRSKKIRRDGCPKG